MDNGTRGVYFFDAFESRRSSFIGLLPGVEEPPPFPPKPDALFADDFESGDLAAWAQVSDGGGDLTVSASAAITGSYGLQAVVDDNAQLYVVDWRPFEETRYRARFYFDPNGIAMADGDEHIIFSAENRDGWQAVEIALRFSAGDYLIRANNHNDTGWLTTPWVAISDGPHAIEFDWQAASAPGAYDGALAFWVDGVEQFRRENLDNDTRRIDKARLGAVKDVDNGTRGIYFFDAFESRRDSFIGSIDLQGSQALEIIVPLQEEIPLSTDIETEPSEQEITPESLDFYEDTAPAESVEPLSSPPIPAAATAGASQVISQTVITYTYDALNRLTAADYSDGTFFYYAYDAAGNRLSETTQAESNVYTYDDANRLASANGVAYTWDANGNLLSDGVNSYTYDGANRLTGVTDGVSAVSYAYNGLGARLQTSASGQNTRYTLDLVSGLTQVLDDGGYTYLYGNGRIAQYGLNGGEYFLGDALGSVRQLADAAGAVRLTRSYQPYGELFASNGEGASVYGFTGEATDALTGMVYLRARYYDPVTGRLLSKDIWQGDYYRPLTMNGWNYVEANPVNLADPTGLYSSNAIHAMIQAHFEGTYGASHIVVPEFFVAGGSKQGLQLENDPSGNPLLTGIPTGEAGYIDIVDITTHQAYEIKHEREILNARAEINWYISIYNQNPRPAGPANLTLGTNYRWAQNGWEVIGTNPYYPGQVILAQMKASGVISYKGEYKDKIPVPLPRYVWEWDPDKKAVEKRDRTKIPDWIPNPAAAYSDAIEVCKVVIVVGGTIIILIDPLPDEPLLPFIWGVVP